jgi:hypothetical protein
MSAAALQSLASAAASTIYDAIGAAQTVLEIDELIRCVWRCHLDGAIEEGEAARLIEYAELRRPERGAGRPDRVAKFATLCRPNLRPVGSFKVRSRFPRRREQRSPDRQSSYDRRHRLAYSGVLPRHLTPHFTIADMAIMRIVADEYKRGGTCELPLGQMAARAGVCRKTAQRSIQKARDERLISVEERPVRGRLHKPHIIRIMSLEWLKWLRRGTDGAANDAANCGEVRQQIVENARFHHAQATEGVGHFRRPTDTTKTDDVYGSRADENRPQVSKEAIRLAGELTAAAGYDAEKVPDSWRAADPPLVVDRWLRDLSEFRVGLGTSVENVVRSVIAEVMRRKRRSPDPSPPRSPRYFTPEIAKLIRSLECLPEQRTWCAA